MGRKNKIKKYDRHAKAPDISNTYSEGVKHNSSKDLIKLALYVVAIISLSAVGAMVLYVNKQSSRVISQGEIKLPAPNLKQGGVYGCRKIPPFIAAKGLKQPVVVDTKQDHTLGPVFREYRENGNSYNHPDWATIGHTGSIILDKIGNVFVFPFPAVSLDTNPLGEQNRIYKIDGKTAEMELFIELSNQSESNNRNPFGVVGLTYDCDTDSLYASSISGSEHDLEKGVVYQINLKTGSIVSRLEGRDILGMGIFNTQDDKRLYFGSARDSGIYSISLSRDGKFQESENIRYEFALSDIPEGSTNKAKKIKFVRSKDRSHTMVVSELAFDYRLVAQTTKLVKDYYFKWQPENNAWDYETFVWQK